MSFGLKKSARRLCCPFDQQRPCDDIQQRLYVGRNLPDYRVMVHLPGQMVVQAAQGLPGAHSGGCGDSLTLGSFLGDYLLWQEESMLSPNGAGDLESILQGQGDRILAPFEEKVGKARDDASRQRAQSDLDLINLHLHLTEATVHGIPNKLLKLEALPMSIDLGGITATIEAHPGHAPDNIIVRVLDQNISFTGDLVCHQVYPILFSFDDDILRRELNLLASGALTALRSRPWDAVVEGRHGPSGHPRRSEGHAADV
jgi:hypothetical protein